MSRFEDLDADAQRRIAAAPPELREFLVASCPTAEMEAAARADRAERDRQRLADERKALLELADDAEAGVYGPDGKDVAQRFLANGRTNFALSNLRSAIRKLRLRPVSVPAAPSKFPRRVG